MSNFDDDCTVGGSKVQLCDARSHRLTAYEGVSYEKNFRIELVQYWKACSCAILFAVWVGDA